MRSATSRSSAVEASQYKALQQYNDDLYRRREARRIQQSEDDRLLRLKAQPIHQQSEDDRRRRKGRRIQHKDNRRRETVDKENIDKKRTMSHAVSAVVGLIAGVASTLLVQMIRRRG